MRRANFHADGIKLCYIHIFRLINEMLISGKNFKTFH